MKRKISASAPYGKVNAPLILFGARGRHNLGDLLFPHIAAPLLAPLSRTGRPRALLPGQNASAFQWRLMPAERALCRN